MNIEKQAKGFTLLELLIVIAILAILAMALVLIINPAESLKKSRDSIRISDLSSMKTAMGLYLTSTSIPDLTTEGTDNARCFNGSGTDTIFYSVPTDAETIADSTLNGGAGSVPAAGQIATTAANTLIDGTGWLPVKFDGLSGGSPISSLPIDPTNKIVVGTSALSTVSDEALAYRYVCDANDLTFEIDAKLESDAFGTGSTDDDKGAKDGGNNAFLYETGTKLTILGAGQNF